MIRLSSDSLATGDTARLLWQLPAGAKVLRGPQATDSLAVRPDSAVPGSWTVQPLAPARFGGDTLLALGPGGDTLREEVPAWSAHARIDRTDSAAASVLPPQAVPVPFPWDVVGWCALGAVLAALAVLAWVKRPRKAPQVPPPPPRDPVEVCRERLEEIAARSEGGHPPREIAFECGELLRGLHGSLHGWTDSVESTSREWMDWTSARRPASERISVRAFLDEADSLRYADSSADASRLLSEARLLLDSIARHRAEGPA